MTTVSHAQVSVYEVEKVPSTRRPYRVRRRVAGVVKSTAFTSKSSAQAFHRQLTLALSHGEKWDTTTGLPASQSISTRTIYTAAIEHFNNRRPELKPTSRKSLAEGLAWVVTTAIDETYETPQEQNKVYNHIYNTLAGKPTTDTTTDKWIQQHSILVVDLDVQATAKVLARLGTNAAPTTLARRRACLSQLIRAEIINETITRNPLELLPRTRNTKRRVSTTLKPDRVTTIENAYGVCITARKPFDALFTFILLTGCRPGEASCLRWEDLQLPDDGWGQATIRMSGATTTPEWDDNGVGGRTTDGIKHRAIGDTRTVPVPHRAVKALQDVPRTSEWVFTGRNGVDPVTESAVYQAWKTARRKATGLREDNIRTVYDLRHCYVSTAITVVPATVIAERCGNDVATLLNFYSHFIRGEDNKWNEALDGIL